MMGVALIVEEVITLMNPSEKMIILLGLIVGLLVVSILGQVFLYTQLVPDRSAIETTSLPSSLPNNTLTTPPATHSATPAATKLKK